ncbi:MAG TPA: DNA polymerase III subunit delta' [Geminicoccaceae bacterium]|nr:DNA polymerase III subunit delta' [Geminicoccaceae bacterium]
MAEPPPPVPEPRANPELIGHGAAERALLGALRSGRLGHAWLLHGPRGIGKATLAYRFARYLLAGGGGGEASSLAVAPDHRAFRLVAQGAHPDLTVLEVPVDAAGRAKAEIPVDAVRAVTAALQTTAAGERRVVVIDGAEALNRNAANALLKLLEEPPGNAVLLLVSHQPGRLAATIRSRCAMLRLRPLGEDEVARGLARLRPELAEAETRALARLARGSLGRAVTLAATGWLPLYQRLLAQLTGGGSPAAVAGRDALAAELGRLAEARGVETVAMLLQEALGRLATAAVGRPGPPLFAGEAETLARLAAAAPLDRWAVLWDKLARLPDRIEGLSLDRSQSLVHILSLFPTTARDPSQLPGGGSTAPAPPGGR